MKKLIKKIAICIVIFTISITVNVTASLISSGNRAAALGKEFANTHQELMNR